MNTVTYQSYTSSKGISEGVNINRVGSNQEDFGHGRGWGQKSGRGRGGAKRRIHKIKSHHGFTSLGGDCWTKLVRV